MISTELNRREFTLSLLPTILLPSVAAAKSLPSKGQDHGIMAYRGERAFVVLRHECEFIGLQVGKQWAVFTACDTAWSGWANVLFDGADARNQAECAARTYVLGLKHGWPCLMPPEGESNGL
jgi:hypothetical protein